MEGERGFKPSAAFSSKFSIPSKDNGKLIGKGGATIQELTKTFNVKITVPKGQEPSTEVLVEAQDKKNLEAVLAKMSQLLGFAVGGGAGPSIQAAATVDLSTSAPIREALFYPGDASFEKFISFLRSAKRSMDVAVFTLSDQRVTEVLLAAHRSGVKIRILTDNDTVRNTGSDIEALAKAGISVRLDGVAGTPGGALRESSKAQSASALMHHKFAVLDGKVLITGSYNWTSSASSLNSENQTITNEAFFVSAFEAQFELLWAKFAQFKI